MRLTPYSAASASWRSCSPSPISPERIFSRSARVVAAATVCRSMVRGPLLLTMVTREAPQGETRINYTIRRVCQDGMLVVDAQVGFRLAQQLRRPARLGWLDDLPS